ncbi:MAG: thiamine phosphate synthase [Planctomycetes bacterium]|nr:thiamine phosphate synthase [Planctomycetota bacterium]
MERSICRIIDANFNRAREAARVVEEFCRFSLNANSLTARTKQLRHELSSVIAKLDSVRFITSRDTLGDVGVGKTVENQLNRCRLKDCFTAGCKRLTEALRVLTETIQTIDSAAAQKIENLRYTAYTLEKDIVLFSNTAEKFNPVKLYVVITSCLPADILFLTARCAAGGADCIQLRCKEDIDDDELFALSAEFVKICGDSNVLSIINDRADIAIAAGADGVHLGQNDLPIEQVRRLQLEPMLIGKSTHSLEQLRACFDELPTYVGLGPVFETPTKPTAKAVGFDYVKKATAELKSTGIGHVAIGGINPDNVEDILRAGAKAVAVCSAVTTAADPAAVCRALKQKITDFSIDNE